jgi:photosystem II stability/assembly factor-like uncharacterized protein
LLAGTNRGIFRLENDFWIDSSALAAPRAAPHKPTVKPLPPARYDGLVYAMAEGSVEMFAATSDGLLRSNVDGTQWEPVRTLLPETRYVALMQSTLFVAGLKHIALSQDGGAHWTPVALPGGLTQIASIAVDDQKNLWVGGREGVFFSANHGDTWQTLKNLNINEVDGISFDAAGHRLLITCADSTMVFEVNSLAHTVSYMDSGWRLRFARSMGDYMLGITLYDGVVVQPKMVDSAVSQTNTEKPKAVGPASK